MPALAPERMGMAIIKIVRAIYRFEHYLFHELDKGYPVAQFGG